MTVLALFIALLVFAWIIQPASGSGPTREQRREAKRREAEWLERPDVCDCAFGLPCQHSHVPRKDTP